jgi:hypothetical protein
MEMIPGTTLAWLAALGAGKSHLQVMRDQIRVYEMKAAALPAIGSQDSADEWTRLVGFASPVLAPSPALLIWRGNERRLALLLLRLVLLLLLEAVRLTLLLLLLLLRVVLPLRFSVLCFVLQERPARQSHLHERNKSVGHVVRKIAALRRIPAAEHRPSRAGKMPPLESCVPYEHCHHLLDFVALA